MEVEGINIVENPRSVVVLDTDEMLLNSSGPYYEDFAQITNDVLQNSYSDIFTDPVLEETLPPDNSRDFSKATNCSSDNAGDDYVPSDISSTSDESVSAASLLR
ncbi:uncharacterized protein LOC126734307 isoform X2 [Anthonomus grandis grandis]|uniref:uncharacterized protein LOC126734307 isoform X2 n=1 Tax=Anthonomus grandis grandis TaxID=2921223 RepID=UPI002165A82A|nr:uncharacterized protein LOC126734307 isoform X2 [Anthonomus grandis grandis]